jgi:hypothetical protein
MPSGSGARSRECYAETVAGESMLDNPALKDTVDVGSFRAAIHFAGG